MSPEMEFLMDYWPSVVFVPTILVIITLLALATRYFDKRDESRR